MSSNLMKNQEKRFKNVDYLVIITSSFLTILIMCIVFMPLGFLNSNILLDGDALRFWTEIVLPILTIFGAFGAIFVIVWQTNRHIAKIQYQIDEQKRVRSETIRILLPFHLSEVLAVIEVYERVLMRLVDAGQGHYSRSHAPDPLLDGEISEFRLELAECQQNAREFFELIAEFHSINTNKKNNIGFILNTMRYVSARIENYLEHRQFLSHQTREILLTFESICVAHKYIDEIFNNVVGDDLLIDLSDHDRSNAVRKILMFHFGHSGRSSHAFSEFQNRYQQYSEW